MVPVKNIIKIFNLNIAIKQIDKKHIETRLFTAQDLKNFSRIFEICKMNLWICISSRELGITRCEWPSEKMYEVCIWSEDRKKREWDRMKKKSKKYRTTRDCIEENWVECNAFIKQAIKTQFMLII